MPVHGSVDPGVSTRLYHVGVCETSGLIQMHFSHNHARDGHVATFYLGMEIGVSELAVSHLEAQGIYHIIRT